MLLEWQIIGSRYQHNTVLPLPSFEYLVFDLQFVSNDFEAAVFLLPFCGSEGHLSGCISGCSSSIPIISYCIILNQYTPYRYKESSDMLLFEYKKTHHSLTEDRLIHDSLFVSESTLPLQWQCHTANTPTAIFKFVDFNFY